MTYLVVGLEKKTLAPWHENIGASDVTTAVRIARARAAAEGIDVVVASVIGPNLSVLSGREDGRATSSCDRAVTALWSMGNPPAA
jgi:hypothetical protein